MEQKVPFVLASGSPRRKELLMSLGIDFTVMVSDADETTTETDPEKIVAELSRKKGEAILPEALLINPETAVISSDTIVYLDGKVLGKPKDRQDAERMLSDLSGRTHSVYTGVTLFYSENGKRTLESFVKKADVFVGPVSKAELNSYLDTPEPYDKAGGYGIQGTFSRFITGISGDFYTIMGLPVNELYNKCREKKLIFV